MNIEPGGAFEVALFNQDFFTNASNDDLQIRTMLERQRILMGTRSNAAAALMVTSNCVNVNNNLYIFERMTVGKCNGDINYPVDVIGNTAIDGLINTSRQVLCRGLELRKKTGSYYSPPDLPMSYLQGISNDPLGVIFYLSGWGQSNAFRWTSSNDDIELMRLSGTGNLGIGTSNPTFNLHNAGTTIFQGQVTLASHIIPASNELYDLGASNNRFRDLYISGNTIHIGPGRIQHTGQSIVFTDSNNQVTSSTTANVALSNYGVVTLYTSNNNLGIATTTPTTILEVNGTDAMLLPRGTTAQRPVAPKQGQVRYNTSINTFEGYGAGNAWGSLGGVKDTNQDTYISAESFPSSNDDILRFYTSNQEAATILPSGRLGLSNPTPTERFEVSGGNAKFNSNIYVLSSICVGTSNPAVSLHIAATDAALLPSGTTAQRPAAPQQGYVRYNTSINTFEGYGAGNAWGSLGGVKDTNQDTYISAESFPTSNDDTLRFYTSNNQVATILPSGRLGLSNPAPTERFEVSGGNAKFNSNIYVLSAIGVGTSNPTTSLEVNGSAKISSNLEVQGTLTVLGPTTTVSSQTVTINDNIIRLNNGAAYTSSLQAGLEINRGTGCNNYLLVFDEPSQYFKVGLSNQLQAVATREDTPAAFTIPFYDAPNFRYGTGSLVYSNNQLGVGTTTPTEAIHVTNKIYSATQVLSTSNDSASIPAFSFREDSNTGIFHPANDTLGITTAGIERVRITATGQVGIGQTSPYNALQVSGNILGGIADDTAFGFDAQSNPRLGILKKNGFFPTIAATTNAPIPFGIYNGSNLLDGISSTTIKEVMRIHNNSNVGIGTSNPQHMLHVTSNIFSAGNYMFLDGSPESRMMINRAAADQTASLIYTRGGSTTTTNGEGEIGFTGSSNLEFKVNSTLGTFATRMVITNGGGVGIGTMAPQSILHAFNNSTGESAITMTNSNAGSGALAAYRLNTNGALGTIFFLNSSTRAADGGANTTTLRCDAGDLRLQGSNAASTTKGITIKAGNNYVGAGTSNPATLFQLASPACPNSNNICFEAGTLSDGASANSGWSAINFNGYHNGSTEVRINTSKNRWRIGVDQRGTSDFFYIDTYNGTSFFQALTATTGGLVGIGTTNPGYTLDVAGDIRVSGDWRWAPSKNFILTPTAATQEWSFDMMNSGTFSGAYWQVWSQTQTSILACMADTGRVGIKTTTPGYTLEVAGAIYASGDITALSDARYKDNLAKVVDPLGKINNLTGYTYSRKDHEKLNEPKDKRFMGLVAQEVQPILPEAVSYDAENDKYGINYGSMAALFVEAIKELKQQVVTLQATVEDQAKTIDSLKSALGII